MRSTRLVPIVGTTAALAAWVWTGPPGIAGTARARNRATRAGRHAPAPGPHPGRAQADQGALESDEFVDEAPATVYAKLLDQGTYLGSVSTMYRILARARRGP
jgi:hypothetical protein